MKSEDAPTKGTTMTAEFNAEKSAATKPDHQARVFALVADFAGVRLQRLAPETTLFGDLGIDGDDAVDLFAEFEKAFQVNLAGFKIERYFGPEGGDPLSSILTALHGWWIKDSHRAAGVEPITLGDLVEAARAGKWVKA